nr:MAG TPA: hypothetical protein [Herelleviridae sp.]
MRLLKINSALSQPNVFKKGGYHQQGIFPLVFLKGENCYGRLQTELL